MSAEKHTPGPWAVNAEYFSWLSLTSSAPSPDPIVGPNGEPIISTSEWVKVLPKDGQLMAAAPDLLEALIDVLPYAEACIGPSHRINTPSDSVITAARAAIAKATGSAA